MTHGGHKLTAKETSDFVKLRSEGRIVSSSAPQGVVFKTSRGSYITTLTNPIAAGRFTDIQLARDEHGRDVVIKQFRRYIKNQHSLDGYWTELEALSQLKHPNVLPILDWSDETHPNTYFLVLPYQDGGNLRALLQGRAFVPPHEVLTSLRQVASAIDYAHSRGVVHGDIKPENILLSESGRRVRLADFGVARHFDTEDRTLVSAAEPVHARNAPRGSSAYLSPEQLLDNESSPRSDLYSFALVVYEVLTGRLPFNINAPLYRQLHARVVGQLDEPRKINAFLSVEVEDAIMSALAVQPSKRPRSARHFVRALDRASSWDIFIAHSSADAEAAGRLHDAIGSQAKVFLDNRCIRPGDTWDLEISKAQSTALITLVLASAKTEAAYYQREEIAVSLQQSREDPNSHRVIPVFLDVQTMSNPHYGLKLKQGVGCFGSEDYGKVAQSVLAVLSEMHS